MRYIILKIYFRFLVKKYLNNHLKVHDDDIVERKPNLSVLTDLPVDNIETLYLGRYLEQNDNGLYEEPSNGGETDTEEQLKLRQQLIGNPVVQMERLISSDLLDTNSLYEVVQIPIRPSVHNKQVVRVKAQLTSSISNNTVARPNKLSIPPISVSRKPTIQQIDGTAYGKPEILPITVRSYTPRKPVTQPVLTKSVTCMVCCEVFKQCTELKKHMLLNQECYTSENLKLVSIRLPSRAILKRKV